MASYLEDYTKFEKARLLGARALQISLGAPVMVPHDAEEEPLEIAKREFKEGVIPLTVKREKERKKMKFPHI